MWTNKTGGEGLSGRSKLRHGIEPECCILHSAHVSSRCIWMPMQLILFLRSMVACISHNTIHLSLNLFHLSHGYQIAICLHLGKIPVWLEEKWINSSPDFTSRSVVWSNMSCPVSWRPTWSNIILIPAVMSGGIQQKAANSSGFYDTFQTGEKSKRKINKYIYNCCDSTNLSSRKPWPGDFY